MAAEEKHASVMIEVTELDFTKDKDEQITTLQNEQVTLLSEVEHLKEMLQTASALNIQAALKNEKSIEILQLDIISRESTAKEALHKVRELEEALDEERAHRKELETSLAQQREETSRLAAARIQAEENLKKETLQWEEKWSHFLQSLTEKQQALQEDTTDDLRNRIADLEQSMAEADNSKPKKRSLWKRFLRLFK